MAKDSFEDLPDRFPWEAEGMDKVAFADVGISRGGDTGIQLLVAEGVKLASEQAVATAVQDFLESVEPQEDVRYLLVNAMGSYECWGPNSNNDAWPEAGLCYLPPGWSGDAEKDKALVKKGWPYGLATFYNGHAFAHHVNKDPEKRVGDIVYVAWNDLMKRVELVLRVEKARLLAHGGAEFWAMLERGDFPAVSMGSRVPWDRCSNCTDLDEFFRALATYKPAEHPHPGIAVLRYHERMLEQRGRGIRGIAKKPAFYCDCMKYRAGQTLPSGIRIFVYNDFPRFFDQSLVKRGADKTAYVMVVRRGGGKGRVKVAYTLTGATLDEALGKFRGPGSSLGDVLNHSTGGASLEEAERLYSNIITQIHPKTAGAWVERPLTSDMVKEAAARVEDEHAASVHLRKEADARKNAEIAKDIEGVVQQVSAGERDLPKDVLDGMSGASLGEALGSAAALGMVLRPREFMRICFRKHAPDHVDLADHLALPMPPPQPPMGLRILRDLIPLLLPHLEERSGFDEPLRSRVIVVRVGQEKKAHLPPLSSVLETALPSDFLPKVAALYGGYRAGLMQFLPHVQDELEGFTGSPKVAHLHELPPEGLFTPLSYRYFQRAFAQEMSR